MNFGNHGMPAPVGRQSLMERTTQASPGRLWVVGTAARGEWQGILDCAFQHDWYHLAGYHAMAEKYGEGQAQLFVYREDPYLIAIPLLLRPITGVPGIGGSGDGFKDATSVYGYAGPIASHVDIPGPVILHFQQSLGAALHDLGVVAVFSKLHPLIPQAPWLSGLGDCLPAQPTISIDLALRQDEQRAKYAASNKRQIRRLIRMGAACVEDTEFAYLDDFVRIYTETMNRVSAGSDFYYPRAYFEDLAFHLGERMRLFVALLDGKVISGLVVVACDGIVQTHISGTANDFTKLSPAKLLVDWVRAWAAEEGHRVFHLGGGTSPELQNPLFRFKADFSDRRHTFSTWRWVVNPGAYASLCAESARWNEQHGLQLSSPGFFPAYRGTTIEA